jgi:pyruvate/2-oxoglutarate/acetoin dehydrogenase E1 component
MKNKKSITYAQAINEALKDSIKKDNKVILLGLGVDDPKGIFGTTLDIHKKYPKNVYDLPTAENGFTGIALGLAISGFKPVIVHQRVEFSLLSFEQITNQVAKWCYMSAGKVSVPIVIRLIIGKGWGQGPQHSQSLEVLFSHIPGLKVISPSNPENSYHLLRESIEDPNPIIFFEHRWLHGLEGYINYKKKIKIGKSVIEKKGKDILLISFSYSVIECIKAANFLEKYYNIKCEILNLLTLRPLDKKKINTLVRKKNKVLIVDNGMSEFGISSEISAIINESIKKKIDVQRIGVLSAPIPSTVALAKYYYPEAEKIVYRVLKMFNKKINRTLKALKREYPDQPDPNFTGPF